METFKWLKAGGWVFASLQQCLAGCWLEDAAGDTHFWLDPLQPAWCCLNQSDRRAVKAHFPAPFPFHHIYPYFPSLASSTPPPPPPFLCLILVSVFLPKSIGFTKCTNVFFQESQMHICSVYSKSKGDKRKVSFFIKCKQCRRKFIALSGINTSECSGKVELIKEAFVSSAL